MVTSSIFLVRRRSDGKWLTQFGHWTPWQRDAQAFDGRHDAERAAGRASPGDYRVIEFVPNAYCH